MRGKHSAPEEIQADFIIVGAGSAGCVLANRLSADGAAKVLLLEAGGDDRPTREPWHGVSNLMIHVPVGYTRTLKDPNVNWLYYSEPDANGRSHAWPRGKIFGGSSSINGMLYVRGQPEDYEGWRQLGGTNWGWKDVLPYFVRAEDYQRGASPLRGVGGPIRVSVPAERHMISDAVIDACGEAGMPANPDVNGAVQEGAGYFQLTMHKGRRCSAAVGYLHPVLGRSNLRAETRALVTRVVFDGMRAVGVEYRQHGRTRVARAWREIILAGGAVNSPQLLQLSGIGPGALLRLYGVPLLRDLPAVGENLSDHYMAPVTFRLKRGTISVNEMSHGLRLAREVAKYILSRKGILSLAPCHVTIFAKSRPELASPDIQLIVLPATLDLAALMNESRYSLERRPGLTIGASFMRPHSRGHIRIKSADPAEHPAIVPNYLSDPRDHTVQVSALRLGRNIADQPALQRWIDHEMAPGPGLATDQQLLDYAGMAGSTMYHPVGTCAMGAVVDSQLRVRGVEGLRVVDASIMPRIISGNTNAPVIMIAEKASDIILGKPAASLPKGAL